MHDASYPSSITKKAATFALRSIKACVLLVKLFHKVFLIFLSVYFDRLFQIQNAVLVIIRVKYLNNFFAYLFTIGIHNIELILLVLLQR